MPSFWIAEIRIDNTIETKIRTRRGVTGDEVRSACVPAQYERAGWHDHPQYRRRLLVEATTPGWIAVDGYPATSRRQRRDLALANRVKANVTMDHEEFETTQAEFARMMAESTAAFIVPGPGARPNAYGVHVVNGGGRAAVVTPVTDLSSVDPVPVPA